MEVTLSCVWKLSGSSSTPTFTDEARRNGPLLKAGSSAMEIWLAEAPPLRMEASSFPIWTLRLSAVESFFSSSGRKLSTLMNSGTRTTMSSRTATTTPEMTSKRFMQKCYQKGVIDVVDRRAGLLEHTWHEIHTAGGDGCDFGLVRSGVRASE